MSLEAEAVMSPEELKTKNLGERKVLSPLAKKTAAGGFVPDGASLLVQAERTADSAVDGSRAFEKAGPRERIFFDPAKLKVGVVTAGGLCPGLNNVIRSLVLQLHHGYGVRDILGIRYGYGGMDPANGFAPMPLTLESVSNVHLHGGTMLGTSRARVAPAVAVDFLQDRGIRLLFAIGGDGTLTGAHGIHLEAARRHYELSVIGIPKTIDNDIPFVWRSFGYFTALEKARDVIEAAHGEAVSHPNGVGLVRLMGRNAGFIAAGATLASQEVNFTLIPEVPFTVAGFVGVLKQRLEERRHAVVVVAEGAGQDLIPDGDTRYGPPGNHGFKNIGLYLLDEIQRGCKAADMPVEVKYLEPAYYIRSAAANSEDALLCDQFARHAVHAGMAGKTDTLIGLWYNVNTHVPIELVTQRKKRIGEANEIWRSVLQTTGQPARF